MGRIEDIAYAIMKQEGSTIFPSLQPKPGSVNYTINQQYGGWNVGHMVWASQGGAIPVTVNGRKWASWPTYNDAFQGLLRQIRLDAGRGDTIETFIKGEYDPKTGKWSGGYAPPNENDSERYIAFLSAQLGVDRNTRLQDVIDGRTTTPNPTPAPVAPKPPEPVQAGGKVQKLKRCPACGQTLPEASKT